MSQHQGGVQKSRIRIVIGRLRNPIKAPELVEILQNSDLTHCNCSSMYTVIYK